MDVFAFYDCSLTAPAGQADKVVLWERSWREHGWTPRLITARHARRSKFYKQRKDRPGAIPLLALHAVGGGWFAPLDVLNSGFVPGVRMPIPNGVVRGSKSALAKFFTGRTRNFRN